MANPRPILAASAAVFRGAEVLLVRRGQALGQGLWSLPGGKVEFGETLEAAALREVQEETGLSVSLLGLAGVYEIISGPVHFVIACYAAQFLGGVPLAASDAAQAGFFAPEALLQLPLAPQTAAAIAKARGLAGV